MVFFSERIINISEYENLISETRLNFEVLIDELQKDKPSKETIENLSQTVLNTLTKAEKFEFCIEKRKCYLKRFPRVPKLRKIFQKRAIRIETS